MEHRGSGTPQPANKFKMAGRRMKLQETQLPLDVAQNCSIFVFTFQKFLCWKFRNFIVYFTYLIIHETSSMERIGHAGSTRPVSMPSQVR